MTPEEFDSALKDLKWRLADFCRIANLHRNTVSRWKNRRTPIPGWAASFLGMAREIKRLARLVEPPK
jgi:hypothetical protein